MLRPILFLFITGGITQEWCWSNECAPAPAQAQAQVQAQGQTQTETTDQKLDRILASIGQKAVDAAKGRIVEHGILKVLLDKLVTGQDALEAQGRHLATEATSQRQVQDDKLDSVILAANEFNQTLNHLLEENETLRKRQANS